jgi:hypothetical protein
MTSSSEYESDSSSDSQDEHQTPPKGAPNSNNEATSDKSSPLLVPSDPQRTTEERWIHYEEEEVAKRLRNVSFMLSDCEDDLAKVCILIIPKNFY